MQVPRQIALSHLAGRLQHGLLPTLGSAIIVTLFWGAFGFGWFDFTLSTLALLALPVLMLSALNLAVATHRFSVAEVAWRLALSQILTVGLRIQVNFSLSGRAKKPREFRDQMVLRFAAMAHALRGELRGVHATDDLADLLSPTEFDRVRGVVERSAQLLDNARAALLRQEERLTALEQQALNGLLDELGQSMAGIRLLSTTHAPPLLTEMVPMITTVFCIFLPAGLVTTTGWLTPVAVGLIAVPFLLQSAISEAFSTPFGAHQDCLPLYRDCRTVETSLRAALGQDALPRVLEPFGGVIR